MTDKTLDATALLPCVTYKCASDFVITTISSNVFELIGIRPENILAKRFWEERMLPEDRDRLMSRLNQVGRTEIGSMVHKIVDDRALHVSIAHSFRKLRNGPDESIQGCMVPLTREFRLSTFNDSLISQFIHKIGNHFQLINFSIGSLDRMGTNADEVNTLRLAVDRTVEFTRAFSQYSQPPLFKSLVCLDEILHSTVRSLAPSFDEKKVSLQYTVQELLKDARITADADLLKLAFTAVLQNALDATKSGDQILVSGRKANKLLGESSAARIAIVDNGSGMEKNMLVKASEPFVTSKRDRDGLGLSTALRIVEIHGGQLRISSASGKGTRVQILLPVEFWPESSEI